MIFIMDNCVIHLDDKIFYDFPWGQLAAASQDGDNNL